MSGFARRNDSAGRAGGAVLFLAALVAAAVFPSGGELVASELLDSGDLGERGVVLETAGDGFFAVADVRGIGDFDGDGLDDLAVAFRETPYFEATPLAVAVVRGRADFTGLHTLEASLPGTLVLRLLDYGKTGAGTVLVNPAGDLNKDGLADFFFSYARYRRDPSWGEGATFLFYGSAELSGEGFVEEVGEGVPGVVFESMSSSYYKVDQDTANIGDFDGDGEDDVALGAFSSELGHGLSAGMVSVLLRTRDFPDPLVDPLEIGRSLPGFHILGRSGESIGRGIVAAGDINGDGYADFVVSGTQEVYVGCVYVIFGRPVAPGEMDLGKITFGGQATGPQLGASRIGSPPGKLLFGQREQVSGVGDVNGDGFDDFVVGAASKTISFPGDEGTGSVVYLFYGRPDFPSLLDLRGELGSVATVIHPPDHGSVGDSFGVALARAGDMNGDGLGDFLIGASTATAGSRSRAGEAYLVCGKKGFGAEVSLQEDFDGIRLLGELTDGGLGRYLSSAGDFNGDGALDVLAAAPVISGLSGQARAYIVYGTGSGEAPFRVLDLQPMEGQVRGGTEVVIRGSGFKEPAQVLFGARPASSVQVVSGSTLRAVTPPGERVGPVDVSVTVAGETLKLGEKFEYTPSLPEIDLASPGERGLRIDGQTGSEVGHSLALGDVTGDGTAELILGSELDGWVVSVVTGGSGLPESFPALTPSSRVSLGRSSVPRLLSGARVAVLGDVSGDGISDIGIGVSGAAGYILFGRGEFPQTFLLEDEIAAGRAVLLERGAFEEMLTLVRLGDLTGDGIGDFAVGFPEAPLSSGDPSPGAGEILFVAGRSVWPERLDLSSPASYFARIHGARENHWLAEQLVLVGDVDGDGLVELLSNCLPQPGAARTYLLHTRRQMPAELDVESYVEQGGGIVIDRVDRKATFTSFINLAAAGDVDGDGLGDFLLGDETGGEVNQGLTFLVRASLDLSQTLLLSEVPEGGGVPGAPDGILRVFGPAQRVQSGRAIGPAGDFNLDGFDDFLVGAQNADPFDPGTMSVIFGGADLPERIELARLGSRGLRLEGIYEVTLLDASAKEAGDLNGDGREDFAFVERGSPTFPPVDGSPPVGGVHVVFGLADMPFIRGDTSYDQSVNISDAIAVLGYLFLGAATPRCLDAADSNDTGTLDITDAIYLLGFLFLGGEGPPPPFPDPGRDTTEDPLGCQGI